jgi:hypothetical protein
MDLKQLEQLAKVCRKVGIKTYKDSECEFTLTEEAPQSNYKKKQATSDTSTSDIDTEDTLTEEALLFWSTGDAVPEAEGDSQ